MKISHTLSRLFMGMVCIPLAIIVFMAIIFLMDTPIPLPLSQEQREEIAAYVPEHGVSIYQGYKLEFQWQKSSISMTEYLMVTKIRDRIEVKRFLLPAITWEETPEPWQPNPNSLTMV